MKVLLVGASGKIGRTWQRLALTQPDEMQLEAFQGSSRCDLGTPEGQSVLSERIGARGYDLVVMAAAWTDVDGCEQNPERARAVNTDAAAAAAKGCAQHGCGLIFYSSDYVFNGTGPKDEEAERNPINVYGRTKADAEAAIEESGAEHLIARINVPLAPVQDGASFYGHVVKRIQAGQIFEGVADQWNNPLDTNRIARWSYAAWQQDERGIIHLAGGTYASRFDIARAIGVHHGAENLIKPIRSDALHQVAPRPQRGGLIVRKQSRLFGNAPDLPTILNSL